MSAVPLKECRAASRERWVANTMTTSSAVGAARIPPSKLIFRSDGKKLATKLQDAVLGWAPWLTAASSESGSYDEIDATNYVERVLEPTSPGQDWRILLVEACKDQVNDPDLRKTMKAQHVELKIADAFEQQ